MTGDKILYSPWRIDYILSEKDKSCIFCLKDKVSKDEDSFIPYRSTHCFVILNIYPYNNGHIMVVPYKHVSCLSDLTAEEILDLFATVQLSERIIKKAFNPEGLNIGINIGKAAGAGIEEHLHVHLLPRWSGDTNFMTTVGGMRVIPEAFNQTYAKLKDLYKSEIH